MLFDFDLTRLVARHRAAGAAATLALRPNPDPRAYGPMVTGPDGWIRSLRACRAAARGTVSLFTGVHVLDPALLERLPAGPSDSVRDLYPPLVAEGRAAPRRAGARARGTISAARRSTSRRSCRSLAQSRGTRVGLARARGARVAKDAQVARSVVGRGAGSERARGVGLSVLWEGARVGAGRGSRGSIVPAGASGGRGAAEPRHRGARPARFRSTWDGDRR